MSRPGLSLDLRQKSYENPHLPSVLGSRHEPGEYRVQNDKAMLALKRLTKHYGITQADMLERVLLKEQRRVVAEMTRLER